MAGKAGMKWGKTIARENGNVPAREERQAFVMNHLANNPEGATANQFGKMLGCGDSAVIRLMDAIEASGFTLMICPETGRYQRYSDYGSLE